MFSHLHKNYFRSLAVMIGYIVGVGMFSLPYLTAKAGVVTFFLFLIGLGAVQYLVHLIYANLIVVTKEFHRLPGYVGLYLGSRGKHAVFVAKLIGNYGALLAYIIITGSFLHELLGPYFGGSEFMYASVLFALEAIIVYFGIGMIARVELYMSGLLFIVVILMALRGLGFCEGVNYTGISWPYFFLPYGAMLVALDGNGALPIIGKLLNRDKKSMKSVIRWSIIGSMTITVIFVLTIVGISGAGTSENALSGVRAVINDGVVTLALVFGIFSMMTSVFGVAESVRETLWWDYKLNKALAWLLAVSVPYLFYLIGVRSLSSVVSFIGAVGGGFSAIMLILVFLKLKKIPEKLVMFSHKPGKAVIYLLIGLFSLGILYEIYNFVI